jgi:serine/threonine protein kinase
VNFKNQSPEKNKYIDKSKDIIVENYVFLSMIGSGAFGQIYLSYDMRDNTEVAIKKEIKKNQKKAQVTTESKIYQGLLNIPNNIDLSGNNAIIQDQLQGVPKFYGVGECFEFYYLILEFFSSKFNELL